jgi:hypothetical protein
MRGHERASAVSSARVEGHVGHGPNTWGAPLLQRKGKLVLFTNFNIVIRALHIIRVNSSFDFKK